MEETLLSLQLTCELIEVYSQKANDRVNDLTSAVRHLVLDPAYRDTFVTLCCDNLVHFEVLLNGLELNSSVVINPKINLVYKMIRERVV